MLQNFIWTVSCGILIIYTLKSGTPEKLQTPTLGILDSRRLEGGCWEAWTIWFWTFGNLVVTFPLEVLFMHFFSRLYHTPVKVYVQEKYLLSRNSLCKEVAVLKKYRNKCPKKVLIAKQELLQCRGWSGNADASKKSISFKYLF